MTTQQNAAAVPRRDARSGGVLDTETRQQVAELNRRVIDALAVLLEADPRVARAAAEAHARRGRRRPAAAPAAAVPASVREQRPAALPPGPPGAAGSAILTPALLELGATWLALDAQARGALAACPYLLVELDVARLLASPASVNAAPAATVPRPADAPGLVPGPWGDAARLVFHYAWHIARVAPVLAGFVLGMRARDVDLLRGIGLAQADALAPRAAPRVALRWRDDPQLWSEWLAAARGGDLAALRGCELRGLQRLAGASRAASAS